MKNKPPAGHQPSADARLPRRRQLYARTQPCIIFFTAVYASGAPKSRRSGAGGDMVGFCADFCLYDLSDRTPIPGCPNSRNMTKLETLAALGTQGPGDANLE